MPRIGQDLLTRYAEAVAVKVDREVSAVQQGGLSARDFQDTLHFEFADHSHATFHFAFFIHDSQARALAVFTEHCGFFLFPDHVRVRDEGGALLFGGLED